MKSLSDRELDNLDDAQFAEAVQHVVKKIDAFQFHLSTIEDTDDSELAGVCLDAAEEIFPGTKERIRNRKDELYRDLADKCMAFGLL